MRSASDEKRNSGVFFLSSYYDDYDGDDNDFFSIL
jgi:hypothetical protein